MPNWSSGRTPQAWWASNPIIGAGVEGLALNGISNGNSAVAFFNANRCWMTGIRSAGPPGRSHVSVYASTHITVQNSYFYRTNDSASVNYGVETFGSDVLVENNIFEQVQAPYPTNGPCTGCVYAYNFDLNNVFAGGSGFLNQSGFPHAPGIDHILFEGNIGAGLYYDNFHGTHGPGITSFRNYWNGYQKNEGNIGGGASVPLIINAFSRFSNIIGNVLGNPDFHNVYQNAVGDTHSGHPIYQIGFGDAIPNDARLYLL